MLGKRDSLPNVRACVLLLAVAATLVSAASGSTIPSPTKLLLTIEDMPSGFHMTKPPRLVKARAEARDFDVNLARYGRVAGASVSFERITPTAATLNDVDVNLIKFRYATGAHAAYEALVARETFDTFRVRVGAESVGTKFTLIGIGLRNVMWRHKNVVAYLSGGYIAERPDVRPLLGLVRKQQARLTRGVR